MNMGGKPSHTFFQSFNRILTTSYPTPLQNLIRVQSLFTSRTV